MRTRSARSPQTDEAPDKRIGLGLKLKHARLSRRLTLRELAAEIDCSVSFLSKVENDHIKPSFVTLHRLVRALDINVASLFVEERQPDGPVSVFRESARPVIQLDSHGRKGGIKLERLVPAALSILLEANIHEVSPGAGSRGFISHRGEEMGYVLQGQLELTVEKKSVLLNPGDVFFFASEKPHGYVNRGKVVARILWVNTPPSF
ncbi:MAG: cupin domain-containing protein [Lautropia sp.]